MNLAHCNLLYALIVSILCGSIVACGGGSDESNRDSESSIITGDELNPAKWLLINTARRRENGEWVSEVSSRGRNDQSELAFQDFTNPFEGLSFQADVTINRSENIGTLARAFIQGRFYKSFAAPNRAGEIIANIEIRQEPNSQELIIGAFVLRCEDLVCDTTEPPLFTEVLGTATLGKPHTLSINFDGNEVFTFKVDNQEPVSFEAPPVVEGIQKQPLRIFGTSISDIDPDSEPVEEGVIKANFDNLVINGKLKEDFNAETKLSQQDALVRRVRNGVLEFARSATREKADGSTQTEATVQLQHINALAITDSIVADVSMNEIKAKGANVEAEIGLVNSWYEAATGDVTSTMSMNSKRQIRVQVKSGNELNEQQFFPIDTSTQHNLSMNFDGNLLNFDVDNRNLYRFNVTEQAPIVNSRPLKVGGAGLQINISGLEDNEDFGSVSANIDNVLINGELYDDFISLSQTPLAKTLPTVLQDAPPNPGLSESGPVNLK